MIRFVIQLLMAALLLTTEAAAQSDSSLKLKWENLLPQDKALINPIDALNVDQALEFDNVIWSKNPEQGESPQDRKEAIAAGKKSAALLAKQGIDVEALYAKYQKWNAYVAKRNETVVSKYNRKKISLAGYLLPLEFSDKGSKEFLLVPFIGACIHVPPPPINQTVFIHTEKPYVSGDLYEPVWVTGKMNAKKLSKSLSLVDGTSKVSVGYTVSGAKIVGYKD